MLEAGSKKEAKYLNRVIRRGEGGIEWECDPKHMNNLLNEYGMEGCKGRKLL